MWYNIYIGLENNLLILFLNGETEMEKYANQIGYSDINPFEVVKIHTDRKITVREMDAERSPDWKPKIIDGGFAGHCENNHSQKWEIKSNENGREIVIRLGKKGWKDKYGARYTLAEAPRNFMTITFN